jgi:hypothetical protein
MNELSGVHPSNVFQVPPWRSTVPCITQLQVTHLEAERPRTYIVCRLRNRSVRLLARASVNSSYAREVEDHRDDRDEAEHHHRPVHVGRSRVRRCGEEHHHCKSHVSNETYVPSVTRLT